ncbi:hypothetical protein WJX82_008097 [Trebouxia sp. C0006]
MSLLTPLAGLDKVAATDRHGLTDELHSQCQRSSVALKALGSGVPYRATKLQLAHPSPSAKLVGQALVQEMLPQWRSVLSMCLY